MKGVVAVIFGFAMAINAALFVPQAWRLWKTKSAEGVSILAFAGFNALQLVGVLHGYFQRDRALMIGMLVSLVTCGSVTLLATRYTRTKA
ncbi:MAG: PQ-loop domain-containing transporter [Steroidobacteraceae bacterium]